MDINIGKTLKFIGSSTQLTKNRIYLVFKNKQGCNYIIDDYGNKILDYEDKFFDESQSNFKLVDDKEKQKDQIVEGSKVWVVSFHGVTIETITHIYGVTDHYYQTENSCYDINGLKKENDWTSERIFLINEENQKALQKIYPNFTFQIPKIDSDIKRRYDIIKKLYNSGKIVVVRYGNTKYDLWRIGILTNLKPENNEFPYIIFNGWKYACAIDLDGNEITSFD